MPTAVSEPAAGSTKVYLDAPHVTVRWDAQWEWVIVEWRGSGTTPEFRAAQEISLVAIHENHALRFLSNARNADQLLGEDRRWLEEHIVPRFAVSGVRWLATVVPVDQVARLSLANVVKTPASGSLVRAEFRILDDAKVWLAFVGREQQLARGLSA